MAATPVPEDPPSLFHLAVVVYVNTRIVAPPSLRVRFARGGLQNTLTFGDLRRNTPHYFIPLIREACFDADSKITLCAAGHFFVSDNFTKHYGSGAATSTLFLNVYPHTNYGFSVCREHVFRVTNLPDTIEDWYGRSGR